MIRFAVIADPHVHDCTWAPAGTCLTQAVRSFAETADSTRIFNESVPAFRRALERAVEAGAGLVLLVGDLTDDGQEPNIRRAMELIAEFRTRHGLRVLATPGNHDLFALGGRPMVKGYLSATGATYVLDSAECAEAACLGTRAALELTGSLGYRPEAGDLHWESPFGTDPAWEARSYQVRSPDGTVSAEVIDASYLVEPVAGLWVLSLDSNVPVPRDGADDLSDPAQWTDPTGAGWNAVLSHRPHLLPWMKDVAARAKAQGKHLISFSHYPVLDALGISAGERAMLGNKTGLACREPLPDVAKAFAATGVGLHISGHLHVNSTMRHASTVGYVVNIAAPSPVGFAPGMKIFDMGADVTEVRTLPLAEVEGHDLAFGAYRLESAYEGRPVPEAAKAASHGAFLDAHLEIVVPQRYIPREWPKDMAAYVAQTPLAGFLAEIGITTDGAPEIGLSDLVLDWYRLRKGGESGQDYVAPDRLAFYRRLVAALPAQRPEGMAGKIVELLALMGDLFQRLPDRNFRVSGPELTVTRL